MRTRHHWILLDTCVGCGKSNPYDPPWHRRTDPAWLEQLAAAHVSPADIDYVSCTHLHTDHVGWNTQLRDGRWVPTFPNAKYNESGDAPTARAARTYRERQRHVRGGG